MLAPPYITADLPRLAERLERAADDLVLISRRHLRSNNSWMHNVPVLVKGKDRCTLLVHPARRRTMRRRATAIAPRYVPRRDRSSCRPRSPTRSSPASCRSRTVGATTRPARAVGRERAPRREHQRALAGRLRRRALGQRRGQRHSPVRRHAELDRRLQPSFMPGPLGKCASWSGEPALERWRGRPSICGFCRDPDDARTTRVRTPMRRARSGARRDRSRGLVLGTTLRRSQGHGAESRTRDCSQRSRPLAEGR